MRIKHSACAAASVALAVLALITPALATQANNKPCLCRPTITPLDGTTRTVFVATVNYEDADGDLPAKVEVYIDGTAYPMRLAKGQGARGLYRARLTLPPGEHNYYFYAEDVRGASERFPRYGAKPGPYVGTGKKLLNRLPLLNEGGVHFNEGDDKDIYTYTVKYEDRDKCNPPRVVKVVVDGIPRDMKLHKGTANDGIYLYQTTHKPGPHAYYFVALDGDGDCVTHPALGFLRGPDVARLDNEDPMLLDPKIDPPIGTNVTKFNYSVFYRDDDGDPASLALVYINGVPCKMTRTAGKADNGIYTYRGRDFRTSMHSYYFYFEDGRGGTRRLPETGYYHGPVVMR